MVGRIVCMVKKTGNVAVCKVANCGLGSALKAITPPMKDWKMVEPRRVPYERRCHGGLFILC